MTVNDLRQKYIGKAFQDKYEELAKKKVTANMFEQFLCQLFPIADKSMEKSQQKRREAVASCYEVDDLANFHGTAFGLINAVSDMAAHAQPLRMSDATYGNLFQKVMEGHPYLDKAMALVEAM